MTIQDKLLESGRPFYIIASGAGAGLQDMIWKVPGISKVLLGAEFPYNEKLTDRCLGFCPKEGPSPASYCSAEVAVDLATTAFYRALEGDPSASVVGVGLTASVASTRVHRGNHRVFVATVSDEGCVVSSLVLEKGVGEKQRATDGEICDLVGLSALYETVTQSPAAILVKGPPYSYAVQSAHDLLEARFFSHPYFTLREERHSDIPWGQVVFPGTFAPPTYGHRKMASEAQKVSWTKAPEEAPCPRVIFSITADPPHKKAASIPELLRRAHTLKGYDRVFVKGQPLYIDKARANRGGIFLLGSDALLSMLDPKWGLAPEALLEEFRSLGTSFLVASRLVNGVWITLEDIPLPTEYQDMFSPIQGRWDISSTQVRAAQAP